MAKKVSFLERLVDYVETAEIGEADATLKLAVYLLKKREERQQVTKTMVPSGKRGTIKARVASSSSTTTSSAIPTSAIPTAEPKRKAGRPPGSKNKPRIPPDQVGLQEMAPEPVAV